MDVLLTKITGQAMNYAIRSGITITTTYAIRQCGRLLQEAPRDSAARDELMQLQLRLESKIRIISPAVDMIELISARGNTSLDSAVSLTKEIRFEIQRLGMRLAEAASEEVLVRSSSSKAKTREQMEREMQSIIAPIRGLLARIEDAVPLINLAITTSGVNLSTKLSETISPSRLLQASTFLTAGDTKYASQPGVRQQVGPTWTLSVYMLFAGHASRAIDENGVRETTWKEVIHKTKVKLLRVPLEQLYTLPGEQAPSNVGADSIPAEAKAAEFAYQLLIIEDLNDGRVHTFEDDGQPPGAFEDVTSAGIRDLIPIHEVSKVFYADTGKILNIGGDSETNSPVLLLRRDVEAEPPRRMLHRSQMSEPAYFDHTAPDGFTNGHDADDEQSEIDAQLHRESVPNTPLKEVPPAPTNTSKWRLPADLDPEWIAFEVYNEDPESDSDLEDDLCNPPSRPQSSRHDSPGLSSALSKLNLSSSTSTSSPQLKATVKTQLNPTQLSTLQTSPHRRPGPQPQIKTSLSLLEMLTKLTTLQQFRQDSHLSIEDELLNFFLEDSATAGAGLDREQRTRLRREAQRRVGFDPYEESPVKRRGEEYVAGARADSSPSCGEEMESYTPLSGISNVHPSIEQPFPSSPSPMRTPPRTASPQSVPIAKQQNWSSGSGVPPSGGARKFFQRAQSEPKARSPLAREMSKASMDNENDE